MPKMTNLVVVLVVKSKPPYYNVYIFHLETVKLRGANFQIVSAGFCYFLLLKLLNLHVLLHVSASENRLYIIQLK